jgi:phosphoenolpyruvate carboxykinase (GTP)
VADVDAVLDDAGLKNVHVHEYVRYWAALTSAGRVEVVGAGDDARLLQESLAVGEILPAGEGRYYARSYVKDTARSEERTIVATSNPADQGVYNNWRPAAEMKPLLEQLMRGASAGKTMYVVPYLMAPPGSALERYAAGVELTDHRTVALHMIRMARVGVDHTENLADPNSFVRAVHVTGDLASLGQGTLDDQRYFVTVADERTILHFGSSYGGNALLGKIAHGLRQAAYDGWRSGEFLAEQFMLIGITDDQTGRRYHICGGFPSASGKTNLAMMLAPDALGGRYHVEFYGGVMCAGPRADARRRLVEVCREYRPECQRPRRASSVTYDRAAGWLKGSRWRALPRSATSWSVCGSGLPPTPTPPRPPGSGTPPGSTTNGRGVRAASISP